MSVWLRGLVVSCSFERVCGHGSHRAAAPSDRAARVITAGCSDARDGPRRDTEERPGMTEYYDKCVQAWRRTRTPATTHAGPQLEARRTDSGGLTAVAHLHIKRHGSAFFSRRVLQYPRDPLERRV